MSCVQFIYRQTPNIIRNFERCKVLISRVDGSRSNYSSSFST